MRRIEDYPKILVHVEKEPTGIGPFKKGFFWAEEKIPVKIGYHDMFELHRIFQGSARNERHARRQAEKIQELREKVKVK